MLLKKKTISLWLVLLVIFIDWIGIGLVYPLFSSMLFQEASPFLDASISNHSRSWILGILLASFSIAQFFSGPILGALSDQKGRKPIFLISLLIALLGYLVCTLSIFYKSLFFLILGRTIVGVAAGNSGVVSAAIADLSTEENKAKNFGLYSMACGVGFTIGPFLGGELSRNGYEIPFLVASLVVLINWVLIFFFFAETHHNKKMAKAISWTHRMKEGLVHCKKAFLIQELRLFFAASLIFCFGWSFFYEFIPVSWIQDFQFTPQQIGLAYAYGALIYAIGSGGLIRLLVRYFSNATLLLSSLFGLSFTIFAIAFPLPSFAIWIYLIPVNLLVSIAWPTFTTLVSESSPKESQGETLGMFLSIQAIAFAVSPLLAGPVLAHGAHFTVLTGSLSMLIASLIILGFIKKQKNQGIK